jgi:hypothetical protein
MLPIKDISGQTFGYLTALERENIGRGRWKQKRWLCRCICGTEKYIGLNHLTGGRQRSCGCKKNEMCSEKLSAAWKRKAVPGSGRYCTPEHNLFRWAKKRAKDLGVPFDITVDDIVIPTHCPFLGIELKSRIGYHGPLASSPTLDRIIPKLGYVCGNILVISHKANTIKQNATLEELELIVQNWRELECARS